VSQVCQTGKRARQGLWSQKSGWGGRVRKASPRNLTGFGQKLKKAKFCKAGGCHNASKLAVCKWGGWTGEKRKNDQVRNRVKRVLLKASCEKDATARTKYWKEIWGESLCQSGNAIEYQEGGQRIGRPEAHVLRKGKTWLGRTRKATVEGSPEEKKKRYTLKRVTKKRGRPMRGNWQATKAEIRDGDGRMQTKKKERGKKKEDQGEPN